ASLPSIAPGSERKALRVGSVDRLSVDTGEPSRRVGRDRLAEGGDVPRPQQMTLDEPVHAGGCGVLLGVDGTEYRIRRQVDAGALDLADIELTDSAGVQDRRLDVEAACRVAQRLDGCRTAEGPHTDPRQHSRPWVAVGGRATQPPVARLGGEWRELVIEKPGVRGVVEVRQSVVAEAHALAELVIAHVVPDRVVDHAAALPHPEQPGEWHKLGGNAVVEFNHESAGRRQKTSSDPGRGCRRRPPKRIRWRAWPEPAGLRRRVPGRGT